MTTIVFNGRTPVPHTIVIGMEGEHNAETILLEGLPDIGTPSLNVMLPDGTGDVMTITDDGTVTFTRNQTMSGTLTAWVTEQDGTDVVWKSEKFYMAVGELPDVEGAVVEKYPSIIEDVIDDVTEIANLAVEAKEAVFGMSAQAETLPAGQDATASYSQGVLSLGIPTGPQGDPFTYDDFTPAQLAALKGPQGDPGPTPSFAIGTVQSGANPDASITGTDANPVLNLTLPKGDKGDDGDPPEIGIGTVSTGAAGSSADVTITGSGEVGYELNFTIPRGDKGDTGNTGATPAFSIGTVTAGTTAEATITGTTAAPVLNLTLPKGDKGDPGSGDVSEVRGEKGLTGTVTSTGALKADLKSETTMHNAAQNPKDVTGRLYPVSLDANGKLVVSVPLPNISVSDRFVIGVSGDAQSVDGSGKTYYSQETDTIDLATSGASSGTYGPSADVTGANGAAVNIPQVTVDQYGRVTSITNKILTCVDTDSVTDVQLNGSSVVTSGVANIQVTGVPSGGTAGQVLRKNSGNTGLEWGTVSGGASTLGGLNNVSNYVDTAAYGDGLVYNGGEWTRGAPMHERSISDDGDGNYYIDDIEGIYYDFADGYEVKIWDYTGDNTVAYMTTAASHAYNEDAAEYEFIVEILRYKANGKREKRIFSKRYIYDEDFGSYEPVYAEETPTGMISNTEAVTQAEYNALVSAGTVDSQTLYCIKETV